jgi:hypothetical protein
VSAERGLAPRSEPPLALVELEAEQLPLTSPSATRSAPTGAALGLQRWAGALYQLRPVMT